MGKQLDVTKDNVVKVFFKYTIPTMLGMWSISLASIVDGIFVGKFIDSNALAVINLVVPYVSLLLGLITMLGAGGCVLSGKLLGENKKFQASSIFSRVIQIMFGIGVIFSILVIIFPENAARLLGANQVILEYTVTYIKIYSYFLPIQLLGIGISFFARVNGKPGLTSFALLFSAIMNVFLDWVFVVIMNKGMAGASLATGISQSMTFFILLPSFFSKNSNLRFVIPKGIKKEIFYSMYNGLSELLNETSSGIVAFVFNHVLIQQSGVKGVAAFTIVNYFLYSGGLIAYSVVAAIHGPVSINYGAKNTKRMHDFLKVSILFNIVLGSLIAFILKGFDIHLVNFFLKSSGVEVSKMATIYISIIWYTFFINGINIVVSGYFTSIHKPISSFAFSALRSLILPVSLILIFNTIFKNEYIFYAVPLSELLTLIGIIIYTRFGKKNLG
ncbi:MAG: hypothetical protein PWP28_1458 [Oceanotoga sp.]|uniref:MATE family efflux transporter n=1 Tax=Oceanotoga sp. TaxID=2108366 RepID=UPI00264E139B|nr:MATE family efflux transporter [Oceanotoga sp.]MDN5342583.1 hypothetical protein [Oceanotoga sp.]